MMSSVTLQILMPHLAEIVLSGYGRYHGPEGLRSFSRMRTIMLASDRRTREINWFPFNSRTRHQLASLIQIPTRSDRSACDASAACSSLSALAATSCFTLAAQSRTQTHLTIDVHLTQQAHGELAYLVFASPSGFPGDRDKALRHGFLPIPLYGTASPH